MILLRSDCLVFKMNNGESVPCSAETLTIELLGDSAALVDPELIKHAAAAVLYYFKTDLDQTIVSVPDFSRALEKVLREVEMRDLAVSLKTASNALRGKLLGCISKRAAEIVNEESSMMGAIKFKEIDASQMKIIGVVRRLEAEGEIKVNLGKNNREQAPA